MNWYVKQIRDEYENDKKKLTEAGVLFDDHPDFAGYVIIFGKSYKSEDAVSALSDFTEEESKNKDEITQALESYLSEDKPEFEICSNEEWLMVYGNFVTNEPNDEGEPGENEFDSKTFDAHMEKIRAIFDENFVDFVSAKKQRTLCHGWNGAHFTHHNSGIATFGVLTEEKEKEFDSI